MYYKSLDKRTLVNCCLLLTYRRGRRGHRRRRGNRRRRRTLIVMKLEHFQQLVLILNSKPKEWGGLRTCGCKGQEEDHHEGGGSHGDEWRQREWRSHSRTLYRSPSLRPSSSTERTEAEGAFSSSFPLFWFVSINPQLCMLDALEESWQFIPSEKLYYR